MADRPHQPPRDPEFLPEEPGEQRESREPTGLRDVLPGETQEPAPDELVGGPGLDERMQPREPGVAPRESPEQPWVGESPEQPWVGEPLTPSRGPAEPIGERPGFGRDTETTAARGAPETGEPIEPKSTGEGIVDSMKTAFRKVKDAVTPDEGRDEEVRDQGARPGPLPEEPPEGRRGGLA